LRLRSISANENGKGKGNPGQDMQCTCS
jgi:hypothetical protein